MKKILFKILLVIAILLVFFKICLFFIFSNIKQIEYQSDYSPTALGGVDYTITIYKEGKITLSNDEQIDKYHYEVTYQGDSNLYKQLRKIIRKKSFAFFEPIISDYGINDGIGYTITVTTNLGKFEKGGYEPKNKKLKRIHNCIMEYVVSNGNETALTDFYRNIYQIEMQKDEDLY